DLADLAGMAAAGAVAFTDDGTPVMNSLLMRRAFEWCRDHGKVLLTHSEDLELARGAVMHEGEVSRQLGLAGVPAAAEGITVYRDIALAELTGGRLHILHVSTAGSVELIRQARRRGVRVSGEACPHHFTLTDECLRGLDSNFKMAPPLRTAADVRAILGGLADGTLAPLSPA